LFLLQVDENVVDQARAAQSRGDQANQTAALAGGRLAQVLGTPAPVSEKRIMAALAAIEDR